MANLVIPRREIWTQQPQRNLGINRINRIAQGIEFVLNPPTFGLNCATSKLHTITKFGVASIESSAYGIAVSSNNGGYTLASNGIESKLTSAISAIVCFLPRSGSETIFGSVGASYGATNWRIRQTKNYLLVEVINASGVMATCSFYVANWFGQITPIIVGFSYSAESGVVNAWCSVATDQSAAQTGLVNAASVPLNFANNLGGDGNYVGKTYFAAIWSRAISKTEFTALSANPWQIFAPRETRLFVPVGGGGTTTVTRDSTVSYKVQGSVQSSSVVAYGIRSAIQSDSVASYAIRVSAQNDAASAYSIRGSIQQSSTLAYAIRGLVDQAIAASYAVYGAVSSDASATYNILSATSVSTSASAGYNIRGSINQDTAAIYALRGSVTQDTSATYSILSASAVSSSVTAGYAIKGSVQSSIVAGYSIAQTVQAEIAASYVIRAGAVSGAQAAYVIRGLVQQSIAASYAIDGGTFSGSISDADITRIVQAVLAALNATTIPVNIKQVNSITIKGAGVTGNTWGPV